MIKKLSIIVLFLLSLLTVNAVAQSGSQYATIDFVEKYMQQMIEKGGPKGPRGNPGPQGDPGAVKCGCSCQACCTSISAGGDCLFYCFPTPTPCGSSQ